MLARVLDADIEDLRDRCVIDEFSVLVERWDVSPERLVKIAQLYVLEDGTENDEVMQ